MHYLRDVELYYFVNEASEVYSGTVELKVDGSCYWYDAWENRICPAEFSEGRLPVMLEPLKSLILIVDEADSKQLASLVVCEEEMIELTDWT